MLTSLVRPGIVEAVKADVGKDFAQNTAKLVTGMTPASSKFLLDFNKRRRALVKGIGGGGGGF